MTGGRFIFGVGLGYREAEDRAFGLARGELVSRLLSHLDVVRRLWQGEAVTFDSPYCRLAGARTALRPLQRPHPPVWVAANNDRAVERAAEIGDAWILRRSREVDQLRSAGVTQGRNGLRRGDQERDREQNAVTDRYSR